jgi:hypothetical protein
MNTDRSNVSIFLRVASLIVALAAFSSSAQAELTNLANGGSVSFASLVSSNGIPGLSVLINDMLFSNFTFEYLGTSAAVPDDLVPADLALYPFSNQVGIGFSLQMVGFETPAPGDPPGFFSRDIVLGFSVQITNSSSAISGASLGINGTVFGSGLATASEEITTKTHGIGACNVANPVYLSTYITANRQAAFDYVPFTHPQAILSIEKDLAVSGDGPANYASISIVEQTFAQIPEPSTLVFSALAIPLVLFVKRRK